MEPDRLSRDRRVLVTGATGFVGRHALRPLVDRGYDVHAVSFRGAIDPVLPAEVGWHQADLLSPVESEALVAKLRPTHLLHFAWFAVPQLCWTSTENLRWVEASLALLRHFADHGGTRAVAAGSSWEYEAGHDRCLEFVTPLRPSSLYGACKHAVQTVLAAFAAERRMSVAWGRIFSVYGPHDHGSRLVPSVITALLDGRTARCTAGRQVRDFMFVTDVAEALVALLDTGVTGPVNIGSGQAVTVGGVVEAIAARLGAPDRVALGALPTRAEDPPALVPDVRRLRQEVGWRPAVELSAGLEATIEWWRSRWPERERPGVVR